MKLNDMIIDYNFVQDIYIGAIDAKFFALLKKCSNRYELSPYWGFEVDGVDEI